MIQQLKNMPPIIGFNLGLDRHEAKQGEPITIWLATLYNQDIYDFALMATGAAVTKISNYEYTLAYAAKGSYTVQLTVFSKVKPRLPDVPKEPEQDRDDNPKPDDPENNPEQDTGGSNPQQTGQPPAAQPKGIVLQSNILEINVT